MRTASERGGNPSGLLVVTVGSALAATLFLAMLMNDLKVSVLVIGALTLLTALMLSGNIRLTALYGLVITAPLELNKSFLLVPHMGGASAISIDAVDIFMAALGVFLIRDFYMGYRDTPRFPRILNWWLALAALGAVAILIGPMRKVALLEVIRMLKLYVLALLIVNELVRTRQFKHFVAAFLFAVFLQCLVAMIQYLFDLNLGAQILGEVTQEGAEYTSKATYNVESEFTYRVGGLIGHPNLLAIFLAMLLPVSISILFSNIGTVAKALTATLSVLGSIVLVLTLSRSGWLSFAFAFITILMATFVRPQIRKRYVFGRVAMIVGAFVLAIAMSGPIVKRITESDSGAVSFRWEWMEVATRMIMDKPVLGFGLNSFVWFMPPYTDYKSYSGVVDKFGTDLPVVHNIYLLVWAEQGTVGLIIFLIFYFGLIRMAWRGVYSYHNRFLAMVNIGCLGGLVALAADGMASFFIRNGNCGRIFVMIAALVIAIDYWHRANPRRTLHATV